MRFEALASSSKGNAYLVNDGDTHLLLECGLTHKKLLQAIGFEMSRIKACLVTHEHKDHSSCIKRLLEDCVQVYLTRGTAESLDLPDSLMELAHEIKAGEQFTVGSIDILPFKTFHDAAEPVGFCMQSRVSGDILVYAIDTVNLPYEFPGVGVLAVEANFDKAILYRCERMPEKVRHRVENTHMEIDVLCGILRRMDLSRCREIYLLHLSDATSHEGHFINKVLRAVPTGIEVTACEK